MLLKFRLIPCSCPNVAAKVSNIILVNKDQKNKKHSAKFCVSALMLWAGYFMCPNVVAVGANKHSMGVCPTSHVWGDLMCFIYVVTSPFQRGLFEKKQNCEGHEPNANNILRGWIGWHFDFFFFVTQGFQSPYRTD